MRWDGYERRSRLTISGPLGLQVILVGGWSIVWFLLGFILGGGAGVWVTR